MLVKTQTKSLCLEVSSIVIPKSLLKTKWPWKTCDFQAVRMPPEAPIDERNSKLSKPTGQFFFDELKIKIFSLCFLKTNNVTVTFCDFITNRIPFLIWIQATDIPTKNLPQFKPWWDIHLKTNKRQSTSWQGYSPSTSHSSSKQSEYYRPKDLKSWKEINRK